MEVISKEILVDYRNQIKDNKLRNAVGRLISSNTISVYMNENSRYSAVISDTKTGHYDTGYYDSISALLLRVANITVHRLNAYKNIENIQNGIIRFKHKINAIEKELAETNNDAIQVHLLDWKDSCIAKIRELESEKQIQWEYLREIME